MHTWWSWVLNIHNIGRDLYNNVLVLSFFFFFFFWVSLVLSYKYWCEIFPTEAKKYIFRANKKCIQYSLFYNINFQVSIQLNKRNITLTYEDCQNLTLNVMITVAIPWNFNLTNKFNSSFFTIKKRWN